ncbi:MAG TPA: class I SAM-dependent methyltransferase [Gaiellaceae bacterium]|nr:class I SAM-dependent methyltransferase [Gaiellaceae bacterium]
MRYGVAADAPRALGLEDYRDRLHARLEIPALARLLRLPTGGSVLHVGCGDGTAFGPLVEACEPSTMIAVDVDANRVAAARERAAAERCSVAVLEGDLRALPFSLRSFDLVVDFGTCYRVAEPERALAEIARVLRPGGLFLHETPFARLLAHPLSFRVAELPFDEVPELRPHRHAGLWATRRKAR